MLDGRIAGGSSVEVLLGANDDKANDVGGSTLTVRGRFMAGEAVSRCS